MVNDSDAGPTPAGPLWRDGLFWFTLGVALFAVAPFWLPGYFWGANDARHHVYFLFEFNRLVADGIWWPRWSPDFAFGYGYPFFNIYGPFSHFLAEILLHFFGFSYTGAIEAIFGLSVVAGAGTMYGFIRSWMGRHAAVIAALVYTFIPYHLLNLYVRANLAESMAFVWLPLCLWAAREATLRPRLRWIATLGIAYAGLMVTSNLVIVLFTPLLALYILVLILVYTVPDGATDLTLPVAVRFWLWVRQALAPAAGVAIGLGLSAVFWLPMLLERQYVRVDQWFDGRYDYRGNFVYFFQLFSPQWDFGISVPGPDDLIGFQVGAIPLAFALLGVLLAWNRLGRVRWEVLTLAVVAVLTTLAGLQWGAQLWELPVLGTILGFAQFPWRWFSMTALVVSILAGLLFYGHDRDSRLDLGLFAAAALVLLSSYPLLRVEIVEPAEGPVSLAGLMRFQRSSDEMTGSTAWVKEIPTWSPMAEYYIQQDEAGGPVEPVTSKLDYSVFDYTTFAAESVAHNTVMEEIYYNNQRDQAARIVFNHFYYPGWRAYLLDGQHGQPVQELPIIPEEEGDLGRMTVPAPPGEGWILLRYETTPPRTVGRLISWATFALLVILGAVAPIRRFWRQRRLTT